MTIRKWLLIHKIIYNAIKRAAIHLPIAFPQPHKYNATKIETSFRTSHSIPNPCRVSHRCNQLLHKLAKRLLDGTIESISKSLVIYSVHCTRSAGRRSIYN